MGLPSLQPGFKSRSTHKPFCKQKALLKNEEFLYCEKGYNIVTMPLKTPTGLTLSAGEEVLWYERRSWKSLWGWFLLCILTIWLFGFGVIFLLIAIGIRYGSEYAITNKRAYSRYGLIGRRANDANFDKITDTSFSQGTIGRILNYGDVGVEFQINIGHSMAPHFI